LFGDGVQHRHGFVEDTDSARLSHSSTVASYMLRIQRFVARDGERRRKMSANLTGSARPRTLAQKVWVGHVVVRGEDAGDSQKPDLVHLDLHLIHEVSSPQECDAPVRSSLSGCIRWAIWSRASSTWWARSSA